MPNDFFRFKQFTVWQQHCAMKVCTDACLFGAWTASAIGNEKLPGQTILDIGAGTGLLSLMLAQQNSKSVLHAVEIDAGAAKQAKENFASSPWHARLQVFNTAIQSFPGAKQYDFVITNPPFFQNDLASPNAQRNIALHSRQLSLETLVIAIQIHLAPDGHFAVLLPYYRATVFDLLAQQAGYYLQQKTSVQQTPAHTPFRGMLLYGKEQQSSIEQSSIIIKDAAGNYTDAFAALLHAYYLYL